jgi:(p)ppGpp synthase/HD superfamily hydrolase
MDSDVARALAIGLHNGQMYGGEPYHWHLRDVVWTLWRVGWRSDDRAAVGWLHDSIEDVQGAEACIHEVAPLDIVEAVLAVTNVVDKRGKKDAEATWAQVATNPLAVSVKLADRIANMNACIRTGDRRADRYRAEAPGMRAALAPMCREEPDLRLLAEFDRLFGG